MVRVEGYETVELPGPIVRKEELLYKLLAAVSLANYDLADRIAGLIEKIARFEEYPPHYYRYEGEPIGYIVDVDYTKAVAVVLIHRDKIMFFEVA
jgi:hypothetical protein